MSSAMMKAWVVREERHGPPLQAMQIETVERPVAGPGDVVIRVRAAGINYNHIWACLGKPVPLSKLNPLVQFHIGGSDASGVIEELGPGVKRWRVGDEVITHPLWSCGECPECNGGDPVQCVKRKAWGYETSYGAFGEYALLRSTQLLPKPKALSWEAAASYSLKYFTAYRMLFMKTGIGPQDVVLIWGAAGGLGSYAVQLCQAANARPVCVVSSDERRAFCHDLGADLIIDRRQFPALSEGLANERELRRFRDALRELTHGRDPDVVFEHTGQATFPASVYLAKPQGKVVICGATTGYQLSFDVRYLWTLQKQIIGSHGSNIHEATKAQLLIDSGVIKSTLTRTFEFEQAAEAHELMWQNQAVGSWVIRFPESGL